MSLFLASSLCSSVNHVSPAIFLSALVRGLHEIHPTLILPGEWISHNTHPVPCFPFLVKSRRLWWCFCPPNWTLPPFRAFKLGEPHPPSTHSLRIVLVPFLACALSRTFQKTSLLLPTTPAAPIADEGRSEWQVLVSSAQKNSPHIHTHNNHQHYQFASRCLKPGLLGRISPCLWSSLARQTKQSTAFHK